MVPDSPTPLKLLVVDDDASLCMVLKEVMTAHGFEVEDALDGTQALAKIIAEKPALVVLDLMIPGMDGMGIIHQLQVHGLGHIPVIVVSGRYSDPKFVHSVRANANVKDFFKKPFSYVDLAMRIHDVLGTQAPVKKPSL